RSYVPGMRSGYSLRTNVTYEILQSEKQIQTLSCPKVAEPDVEYFCNISVKASTTDVITATFSDPLTSYNFQGLVNYNHYLGDPPPRDNLGNSAVPGASASDFIYKFHYPVTEEGTTSYFEVYLEKDETVTFGVVIHPVEASIIAIAE
ncbi:hypothetical protein SK128_015830, partial [Halocaridina rubra]